MGSLNALARAFCHARLRPPRQSPMSLSIGMGVFRPLLASPRALAATEVRSLRQSQRPQSYTTNHSPPPDTEPTVSDSLRSVMRQLPHPVVVITAPLTEETRGAIGEAQFRTMKDSAFLVHHSRQTENTR